MKKLAVLFILLIFATAYAEDYVAVNSMDGRDVLSGVFYANVKGEPVDFMPLPGDTGIFADQVGSGHNILLIQSTTPVSSFVQNALKSNNNTVDVYTSTDAGATNLYLANLSGAQSFIIVGSAYSDSALSVLPYAKYTHSYVILADQTNINQVVPIVAGKNITIYGLVDSQVTAALAPYNPQIIGTGADQYQDNIAMNSLYMNESGAKTAILSDGSFIEQSMATSGDPIILIGSLVPQPTYNFIRQEVQSGNLDQVLLIGNGLVSPAYDMHGRILAALQAEGSNATFGVIVKFAQVVPSSGTGVLSLGTFPLPAYTPSLNVSGIAYDNGMVMASINNTGDGAAWYTTEIRVRVDGTDFKVFPANGTSLLSTGQQVVVEYPINLSSVTQGNVTALVLVEYGVSNDSLDSYLSVEEPLTTINYVDTSNVSVQLAKYDSDNQQVLVTLRNDGSAPAYVDSTIGLVIGGQMTNVTGAGTLTVNPSSLAVEDFPLQLSSADLAADSNVSVFLNYGGRPNFLLKYAMFTVPLVAQASNPLMPLVLPAIIVVVLLMVIYYLFIRKPQKNEKKETAAVKDTRKK
jgi:hypothetical protein